MLEVKKNMTSLSLSLTKKSQKTSSKTKSPGKVNPLISVAVKIFRYRAADFLSFSHSSMLLFTQM